MASTALNRTMVALLTNNSGGSVAQGDVVIVDSASAGAFTTTTAAAYASGSVGVILEPNGIASGATGIVAFGGYVPKVNLTTAATLAQLIKTSSTAKQATPHSSPIVAGDFGQVLGTGTSPAAFLFAQPTAAASGGSTTLAGDSDVSLSSPTAKQILQYNGSAWVNVTGGLIKVAENVLGGAAASVTLSVPSGYRHLQLFIDSRGDNAANNITVNLTFNSDTGANYDYMDPNEQGSTTTLSVGAAAAATAMFLGWGSGANAPAGESSQIVATILNYAGTTFQKGVRAVAGLKQGTTTAGFFSADVAGWWRSTSAISSITLAPNAGNFVAGSTFTLYALP